MKKIIFDCDNTFGVRNCDVDDGLALLYLLGDPDAQLYGITTTYGNSRLDVVYETTREMIKDLGRADIPVKRGAASKSERASEAAVYLAEMAAKYPGEISVLATGSLTNMEGAYETDSQFFANIKEIVLMGGITKPLIFEKKQMDELNFSCDPEASCRVLTEGRNVSVITGNNCLKVLFTKEEYRRRLFAGSSPTGAYIREKTDDWFHYNEEDYGIKGFYNWDVTAAVYLMHPELFHDCWRNFTVRAADLQTGLLREDRQGRSSLNLPEIMEEETFKENIYSTWMRVPMERRNKSEI